MYTTISGGEVSNDITRYGVKVTLYGIHGLYGQDTIGYPIVHDVTIAYSAKKLKTLKRKASKY